MGIVKMRLKPINARSDCFPIDRTFLKRLISVDSEGGSGFVNAGIIEFSYPVPLYRLYMSALAIGCVGRMVVGMRSFIMGVGVWSGVGTVHINFVKRILL